MVNHLRTLLRNLPASDPSEEYVPPGFASVPLPRALAEVRAALFGPGPDAVDRRLRELLALVHGSELAPFAAADDPRLTYLPVEDAGPLAAGFSATPPGLAVAGTPPGPSASGALRRAWSVAIVA